MDDNTQEAQKDETQSSGSVSIFAEAEDFVVKEANEVENFIDGVFVDDVKPFFNNALALVERNGGALLFSAAANVVGGLVTGNWGSVVAQVISTAKAAGAQTLEQEEQLAASTALQLVQAGQATAPQQQAA
jgi:hypothetical protein